jgi:molybdate transport system substrate-binding protein
MARRTGSVLALLGAFVLLGCGVIALSGLGLGASKQTRLEVFVGSASKPPALEAKAAYEKAHPDVTVDMTFGGSGTLLNQIMLEQTGDIYMPGSDDFMDKAEKQKVVVHSTRKIAAYLVPMINVQHGNPKRIRSLADLAKPKMRIGLAKSGSVCLGDVSDEILKKARLGEQVRKNVVTYAGSCEQTQQLVQLGEVDAIIGWDSFRAWAPDKIDNVKIPANLIRVRNIPAAVTVYSKQQKAAADFVNFLASRQGKAIFSKNGYSVKPPRT